MLPFFGRLAAACRGRHCAVTARGARGRHRRPVWLIYRGVSLENVSPAARRQRRAPVAAWACVAGWPGAVGIKRNDGVVVFVGVAVAALGGLRRQSWPEIGLIDSCLVSAAREATQRDSGSSWGRLAARRAI